MHRGALFSAAPRSPGPAGVHRDFTPQRTAAAERAALGARELVPTAEGVLSGAHPRERRVVPQRAWTGSGRGSGRHGRRTEMG